ncbi:MAG TPA: CDP-glycerol glycerophosphotransferase family protein [Microbacteriaceae bacterium]|nr:CDP-glycerol glycerophosphotransferase family protein [Microbacteriaceae bacterium]HQX35739.1 CDP-glycerol glycerophosphotransferase family protein [Microbacteriaceae bacterium]HQZ47578.1 CDP-glycerol glycerophosphotransferase family protein [Microbacteriaceae bacterium]HRA07917.1 CDP-glycerol glycerophosphotransferase family protein [Microbacteriaceae bacterium]
MASFTFGAGNMAKLLSLPLYGVGRLATMVIPRTNDEWVFGCGAGIGDGALELYELARERNDAPMWWAVTTAQQARVAAARGIPTVRARSLRGFWRTARARVVVLTHGFGDVSRYGVTGATVVQLWHGIPLKRLGLDSPETMRVAFLPRVKFVHRMISSAYRRAASRITVLSSASTLAQERLRSAFGLPEGRVAVTGEPRVDVLSRMTPEERHAHGRALIAARIGPLPSDNPRFVLYAPTWRDGEPDPAAPSPAQWARILEVLRDHDAVLLVRSHPLGVKEYAPRTEGSSNRVRNLGSGIMHDVTPALPGIDVLVTDYSSLAFDVGLNETPVVYLAPDVAMYGTRRGFYGRYEDLAGDDYATDWDEAVSGVAAILADVVTQRERSARSKALSARAHAFRDGRNTERVYDLVIETLAREDAAIQKAK